MNSLSRNASFAKTEVAAGDDLPFCFTSCKHRAHAYLKKKKTLIQISLHCLDQVGHLRQIILRLTFIS